MDKRLPGAILFVTAFALSVCVRPVPVAAQGQGGRGARPPAGPIPRTPDGKPDLQGFWEDEPRLAISAQIEEHNEGFGIREGARVIDTPDGKIPYQPWALAERDRRRLEENAYEDPEGKCAPGGVPHQMYVLFPVVLFLQPPALCMIVPEYVHAARHVDARSTDYPTVSACGGDQSAADGDTLSSTANLNGSQELYGDFVTPDAHVISV